MGSSSNLAGVAANTNFGEDDKDRSSKSGASRTRRGAPPSSLSLPFRRSSRSVSPTKPSTSTGNPSSNDADDTISPRPSTINRLPSTTPTALKSALRPDYSNRAQSSNQTARGATTSSRTVTFRHHLFQPAKNPIKTTFQPRSSDSDVEPALAFDFKSPTPITPTTDITATGEILTSPPTQFHDTTQSQSHFSGSTASNLDIDPSPLSSPSLTTLSSRDTTIQDSGNMSTTETNLVPPFRPGSEGGYPSSPMAKLMDEYRQERDEDLSTQQRATNLHAKKTLAARDIIYLDNMDVNIALVNEFLAELTQVIGELQTFLERTSGLIPERRTFFKVDPRDTFMNILSGATDLPQLHAAWFGLNKRIGLAQENLDKYEAQYRQPNESSNYVVPTSPISTDPGIYDAMSDLGGETDSRMRYLYQNVPHLQEGIRSPRKINGSTWEDILPLPDNLAELHNSESYSFPTRQTFSQSKGKGRSHENEEGLPVSPRQLNVGFGTPFRSSSQFFNKPDRQRFPLPSSDVLSQQNVLVGLGLPNTPAFQGLENPSHKRSTLQSRRSNPFEQKNQANSNTGVASTSYNLPHSLDINPNSSHSNRPNPGPGGGGGGGNGDDPPGSGGGGSNRNNSDPYGNQDGDSNDESISSRTNNRYNPVSRNSGGGDPPGNDPPGGGGGPGRGNFGSARNDSQNQGMIPYGDTRATIRNDLKQDQLPVWDGNKNTAIEYFWKVQQLAALEGDIPQALGYWLWKSLKENSKIWWWFSTLPFSEQAKMRTHYLYYLKGIKDNYLGRTWQINMNTKYESQSFRQEGFERESPPAFITRRIMYTRMLAASDDGGPMEVYLVMQKAPISWGPILNIETVRSTSLLYSRATDHEYALIHAAKYESSNILTADNLLSTLKRLGINTDRNRSYDRSAKLVSSNELRGEEVTRG